MSDKRILEQTYIINHKDIETEEDHRLD